MSWLPKQSVVVPIDFSDESIVAVDTALEMVDAASAIHVIHVLPELAATEPGIIWETVDDNSRRDHAVEALNERFTDAKYQGIHLSVAFGDPGHQIADFAAEQKADLVVLPSHGRTGIRRVLLGSVAERVVRLSHCPVLVLRS